MTPDRRKLTVSYIQFIIGEKKIQACCNINGIYMGDRMELILMDFSGVYREQRFYQDRQQPVFWIDCQDIEGTNCYCDQNAQEQLSERIKGFGPEGIHFLDSGNYHYASLLWLKKCREPFELLMFDHHTDMQPPAFGDILSCGGWLKTALDTNTFLSHIWLAGPPLKEEPFREDGRVTRLSLKDMEDREGWGRNFSCHGEGMEGALPLYISVDKDVLRPEDARTNWNQGELELETLLCCLKEALASRVLIGMDVCGENPEGMEGPEAERERQINDLTNRKLAAWFAAAVSKNQQ